MSDYLEVSPESYDYIEPVKQYEKDDSMMDKIKSFSIVSFGKKHHKKILCILVILVLIFFCYKYYCSKQSSNVYYLTK